MALIDTVEATTRAMSLLADYIRNYKNQRC
jgi:hypothetical protein